MVRSGCVVTNIQVFPDAEELGETLAQRIVSGIDQARAAGKRYLLGCPGGRSPRTTYTALAARVRRMQLDLRHVVIVMMDDYVVQVGNELRRIDPGEHCSVERFAREQIMTPLNAATGAGMGIPIDSLWMPDPRDPEAYDARLATAGGIDLFILASGDSDGHVAFNPPGSSRESTTRIIELAESTRRDNLGTFPRFNGLDDVPRLGISVGIATIANNSHEAVLVAPGESKRTAVERIVAAKDYDPSWPASVLACCRQGWLYADLESAPSAQFAHMP
jgi:glucosamine-6-phosphate deaminase